MITWITIELPANRDGYVHKSSLGIEERYPDYLRVTGNIEHNARIRPASRNDAKRLRDWIDSIMEDLP